MYLHVPETHAPFFMSVVPSHLFGQLIPEHKSAEQFFNSEGLLASVPQLLRSVHCLACWPLEHADHSAHRQSSEQPTGFAAGLLPVQPDIKIIKSRRNKEMGIILFRKTT